MSFGCSAQQLAPQNGVVQLNTANPFIDGSGAIMSLINGNGQGTYVRSITIKNINVPNGETMIRLFLQAGGGPYNQSLINEIPIPAAANGAEGNAGTTSPSFGATIYFNSLFLQPGMQLGVSCQTDDEFVVSANAEYIVGFVS